MPRGTLLLPVGVRLSSQDAKARATRSAVLIEYAYRHEFSKPGTGGEGKYDMVLSA